MALDNLTTLGQGGSKRLGKIAQKAALAKSIINTAEGVTKALTFGPILGPILATTQLAAGLVQIQVIRNQEFRDGGIFTGGIPGVDSINATVQQNEIIAPTQNFEEVIGSVRAKREAEELAGTDDAGGGFGGAQVGVHVTYDSPEASQLITLSQVEDTELGISRDSFKEAS